MTDSLLLFRFVDDEWRNEYRPVSLSFAYIAAVNSRDSERANAVWSAFREQIVCDDNVLVTVCSYGHHWQLDDILVRKSVSDMAVAAGLLLACKNGHVAVADCLLQRIGTRSLMISIDRRWVRFLAVHVPDLNLTEESLVFLGESSMTLACAHGHVDVVERLLRSNPRWSAESFFEACANGHTDVVEHLLARDGTALPAQRGLAVEGLRVAVKAGQVSVVDRLLRNDSLVLCGVDLVHDAIANNWRNPFRHHWRVAYEGFFSREPPTRVDGAMDGRLVSYTRDRTRAAMMTCLLSDSRVREQRDHTANLTLACERGYITTVAAMLAANAVDPSQGLHGRLCTSCIALLFAAGATVVNNNDRFEAILRDSKRMAAAHSLIDEQREQQRLYYWRTQHRARLLEIAVGLQSLDLPAFVTWRIVKQMQFGVPLHLAWRLITAVKHRNVQ